MFFNHVFFAFFTFLFLTIIPVLMAIPGFPDPDKVQTQTFLPNPSPPTTIPAIPEQSSDAACPLDLSEELFHGIKSACGSNAYPGQLHRTRCCPVLAAWLYSAYSRTALRRAATARIPKTATFDMPVLPDDSETCVDSLEKAMGSRGIELVKPNETCDMVYCYCGIRVHPLSCPQSFTVNPDGKLVGDERVKMLEKNCLGNSPNGFSSLAGCSKCLKTLHSLGEVKARNTSKSEDRTAKMLSKDCQLMGLTWLLNKNRSAYFHTVSAVLRALMMSTDEGSGPRSCTLNSDGMPLAVDSSQINNQSSSAILQISRYSCIFPLLLFYIPLVISFPHFRKS
ncbi:uncharacterized GPI-anchored protein At4g28100-like [Ipomoea triloba]|uniref:uncharacterized GPI-anchored protein At4g28100-like n=1 Tax=Ipomoea triloba TaxID=35885 RepID=UPI00125DC2C4|nr:uncharacterized GPI-anchored protein At4g28100-like [Ipomoea triloba]